MSKDNPISVLENLPYGEKKLVSHAKGTLFLDYFLKINDYRECKNTIILHGIELLILVK